MKKTLLAVIGLIAVVALASEPYYISVGTNATIIVPEKTYSPPAWSAQQYAQGAVVVNDGICYFLTEQTGASYVAPTNTTGSAAADTNSTWQVIDKGSRTYLMVSIKTSSGAVDLAFNNNTAVTNGGLRLIEDGGSLIFERTDNYQGSISAISASTNAVVIGVQEF